MRSALRCFSHFALSLIFCFAIITPRIAFADWQPYSNSQTWVYNVPGLPPTVKASPKHSSGKHSYSTIISANVNGNYGSRDYPVWNNKPSSNFCNMMFLSVSGSVLGKGTKFKILNGGTVPYIYANSSSPSATDYNVDYVTCIGTQYWCLSSANENPTQLYPDSNGVLTAPYNIGSIYMLRYIRPGDMKVNSSGLWNTYEVMHLVIYYPEDYNEVEAIEQQTIDLGQQTQQQTDTLMDTSGSNGIMTSATGVQSQINSKLGFVSQSASMITGLYDSLVNVSPTDYVTFPELKYQDYVIIPETKVALLGWIPAIEQPIRMFITGVFVLAWLHGVKVIYGKMFLGENEVITDGEE